MMISTIGKSALRRGCMQWIRVTSFVHPNAQHLRPDAQHFSSSTSHITSLNSEDDFHKIADKSLERMSDFLSPLEEDEDVELELSMGVLKLRVPTKDGQTKAWVINKQTPNRQLWWSSPISGPRRYEWNHGPIDNDLDCVRSWTHTRAIAVPGGTHTTNGNNNGSKSQNSATDSNGKKEGDILSQIHSEILAVTGIDLHKA